MTGSNLVSVVNTNTKIEETTVLVGSVPTNIAVFIKPVKLNSVNQNPKLKEISLVVFPNPSSGIVTLKLDGVLTSNYSISIFDLQGRHIKIINNSDGMSIELPEGEYFAKINNIKNEVVSNFFYY
jgi:hypothetical protein